MRVRRGWNKPPSDELTTAQDAADQSLPDVVDFVILRVRSRNEQVGPSDLTLRTSGYFKRQTDLASGP
jgi:hypothetical protein